MKSKTLLLFILSFLFFFSGTSETFAQKTYVVTVGLGNYKYPEIAPSLPCSLNDARAISSFFNNYNGASVFMLLDKNATRDQILKVLEQEFSKSGPKDEIIFAFSGHGLPGGLTCWETCDANTIITYNEIQDIMKRSKARRKIILAMACYSGGLSMPESFNRNYRNRTEKSSVMIFSSSRPDEVSWESRMMKNSFFTDRLLSGLRGAADINDDKKVTARELFNYDSLTVANDANNCHHPQMWGSFDEIMVVVYTK